MYTVSYVIGDSETRKQYDTLHAAIDAGRKWYRSQIEKVGCVALVHRNGRHLWTVCHYDSAF